ncbi:uncharacterized protein LOC124163743 [Ischnura elegans]|uniref:uncharacterized protein LOC124163743 n=1 Tax=Ischnura elegans TaxID=197161 RepID=UPI001ED877BD|nr:uncharacterized protein LOC124163743 [Ischnura elegans]
MNMTLGIYANVSPQKNGKNGKVRCLVTGLQLIQQHRPICDPLFTKDIHPKIRKAWITVMHVKMEKEDIIPTALSFIHGGMRPVPMQNRITGRNAGETQLRGRQRRGPSDMSSHLQDSNHHWYRA